MFGLLTIQSRCSAVANDRNRGTLDRESDTVPYRQRTNYQSRRMLTVPIVYWEILMLLILTKVIMSFIKIFMIILVSVTIWN